jgi:hypothetical protein
MARDREWMSRDRRGDEGAVELINQDTADFVGGFLQLINCFGAAFRGLFKVCYQCRSALLSKLRLLDEQLNKAVRPALEQVLEIDLFPPGVDFIKPFIIPDARPTGGSPRMPVAGMNIQATTI